MNEISPASCCWASKRTLSHVHPRSFVFQTQFLKTIFARVILQCNLHANLAVNCQKPSENSRFFLTT